MAADNNPNHRRLIINHRSASGHLELTQGIQDCAKCSPMETKAWQLPQLIRTKRQSADWKPRRASVAGCQQQAFHNYHYKELPNKSALVDQQTAVDTGEEGHHTEQQQQQQPFPRIEPLGQLDNQPACPIKLDSGKMDPIQSRISNCHESASIEFGGGGSRDSEQVRRYNHYNIHQNRRHRRPTCRAHVSEDSTQSIASNLERASAKKGELRQEASDDEQAGSKISQNLTLCSPVSSTVCPEHLQLASEQLDRLNRSSLDSYSSSVVAPERDSSSPVVVGEPAAVAQQASSTCLNQQTSNGSVVEPLLVEQLSQLSISQKLNSTAAAASTALTTLTMNEKLQIQAKQRKFLIISIALKKMISANSGLLNIRCTECGSKCRQTSVGSSKIASVRGLRNKNRTYLVRFKQRGCSNTKTTPNTTTTTTTIEKKRKKKKKKKNKRQVTITGNSFEDDRSQQDLGKAKSLEEEVPTCTSEPSSAEEKDRNDLQAKQDLTQQGDCKLSSQKRRAGRIAGSKCSDCCYFTDSSNRELSRFEITGSVDTERNSSYRAKMTRDKEEKEEVVAEAAARYEPNGEHLQCTYDITRDYYGSETRCSRASYGSDSSDNDNSKFASNEQDEMYDDGEGLDEEDLDASLESLIVESWLDDHLDFVHDYFMRKASRHLIDDWLRTRAKVSNTNHMMSSQLDLVNLLPHGFGGDQQQSQQQQQQQQLVSDTPSSLASHLNRLANPSTGSAPPTRAILTKAHLKTPSPSPLCGDQQQLSRKSVGTFRQANSRNQSGTATPVRKISATDFESRTGSVFLRPMVSTTPDGRPTFLSQPLESAEGLPVDDKVEETVSRQQVAIKPKLSGSEICFDHKDSYDDDVDEDEVTKEEEVKLIFELVKNICNDLDIRTLLHKILRNIAVLINADKSSLFLVCGEPGDPNRHLVSQLFNVDQDSECGDLEPSDCITIPWNTGLVGYVAESGEFVNIANCYEDPRFTNTVDQRTGYVTKHMLCAPIYDKRNEIVGVAQVINKRDGKPFSKRDEIKFKRYLQFCGIGLRNAQSYENCQLENKRNQVLLDLARMVFEEQSTIEQVVYRIMLHTQSLLECQRCQVLLIDDGSEDLDHLLQLASPSNQQQPRQSKQDQIIDWRPQCCTSPISCSSSSNPNECKNQIPSKRSPKLFSLVFDLECDGQDLIMHSNRTVSDFATGRSKPEAIASQDSRRANKSRAFPMNIGITGYVAMTGETLNIEDAHQSERFDPSVDEGSDFRHKSILCMPIRNGQRQIIGVSQLINKKNGRPFNKNDEDLFEAFSIFCGLGIHNTLMYEKVLKVMAKQRVTFEVLSYHATAPLEEAKKLHMEQVPSCFSLNLASLKFNDFSLDEQFMLKSCVRFFLDLDLIRRFQIDQLVFCNWILSVQKNYRKVTYHPIVGGNGLKAAPVRYHNWRHAFNVSQMMFAILLSTQMCTVLGELETLALLIACLCHDLDHRGTNNSFQIKSASPLAELYSTSTMEHHHFDQCVMILNSQGNQILANLSPDEYSRVIVLLEEAILATDLANYFQKRELFFQLVNSNNFDWHNNLEHRSLLRCMLMTACDVAAITKPWSIQKVVADLVMGEFYQQGDIEKQELNIEPIDMMNRDKMSKLPEMQIGFIDSICAPIYTAFAKLFPHELSPLLDGCLANRDLWVELNKQNNNSRSDLAAYLNNNSTSTVNILPKIRNTSSPEMNLTDVQSELPDEVLARGSFNEIANSSAPTKSQNDNKLPALVGNQRQSLQRSDCQRKSV